MTRVMYEDERYICPECGSPMIPLYDDEWECGNPLCIMKGTETWDDENKTGYIDIDEEAIYEAEEEDEEYDEDWDAYWEARSNSEEYELRKAEEEEENEE